MFNGSLGRTVLLPCFVGNVYRMILVTVYDKRVNEGRLGTSSRARLV